jgi:hypothetical protein
VKSFYPFNPGGVARKGLLTGTISNGREGSSEIEDQFKKEGVSHESVTPRSLQKKSLLHQISLSLIFQTVTQLLFLEHIGCLQ